MNAPVRAPSWTDANQALLVAEFARLKRRLRGEDDIAACAQVERCRAALPVPAAIDCLTERLGLSSFERDLLLLVAGIEMDAEVAPLCAGAGMNAQRQSATFALALSALANPHWSALAPNRPLRHWRLIEVADDAALVHARLRIDERVLHFLAGVAYVDPRLQPLVQPVSEAACMGAAQRRIADEIAATLQAVPVPWPMVQLLGGDPHGKRDVAACVASQCALRLFALVADELPANAHELEALAVLWEREVALADAALLLDCTDAEPIFRVRRFLERIAGLTFVAAREAVVTTRPDLRRRIEKPDRADQLQLWQAVLGADGDAMASAIESVAAQFRLSAHDIHRATAMAAVDARVALEGPDRTDAARDRRLWDACRGLERRRLDALSQHIHPSAQWDDLVLPEFQKLTLRQIAAHLRHRLTVLERWGFAARSSRGLGVTALFAGESGTGKTMAAEVLANELHLELYRVDLSAVMSKYIGETEKNLARLFDAAEDSGAILLFDEADALFGKRSEVKDSHDRYANIEVSYLLQRMEAYSGLAILTTNLRTALDSAFQRRLRFVIHFPFPDAAEREAIWRHMFPPATPLAGIHYAKLARLHVAGGHIRNIALSAAFLAAEGGEPVGMTHLLCAAHADAARRERPLTEAETRGWA